MSTISLYDDFDNDDADFVDEVSVDVSQSNTQDASKKDDIVDEYAFAEDAELLLSSGSVSYSNEYVNITNFGMVNHIISNFASEFHDRIIPHILVFINTLFS